MTNAKRDDNRVPTLLALEQTDGKTIVPVAVNPLNNRLVINNATGGTNFGNGHALRDENRVTTMIGVSSADLTTVIAVYGMLDGELQVNSQ